MSLSCNYVWYMMFFYTIIVQFYNPMKSVILWYGLASVCPTVCPSVCGSVRNASEHDTDCTVSVRAIKLFSNNMKSPLSKVTGHSGCRPYTVTTSIDQTLHQFVYARLQTGHIMVWRCPSGSPSVRLSLSPGLRLPVFRTFLLHALTY